MLEFMVTTILLSIPEAFIKLYFAIKLITPSLPFKKWKVVLYTCLIAIFSNALWAIGLQVEMIFIIMLIFSVILCKYLIEVKWLLALLLTFVSFVIQIIGEFFILFFMKISFGLAFEQIHESLLLKVLLPYLYLLPILLFTVYIHKFQKNFLLVKWSNTKYKFVLPLVLLQLLIGLVIHALYYATDNRAITMLFLEFPILSFAMIIVTFIILMYLEKLHQVDVERNIQFAERPLIEEMDNLMRQWRKYRHDFHNHLEVLYGLLEEKNYNEASHYMRNLHQTIVENQTKFNLSQPAVKALINAKTMQAEQYNIQIIVESKERAFFPHLKSYDVVLLLGNILDNAIHALAETSQTEKIIKITYKKVMNILVLEIANNGPMIPKELHQKIFEQGFSTKRIQENNGNGLAIVKDIVTNYHGEVALFSNEKETVFQIAFPM